MSRRADPTGMKFGRLTVLRFSYKKGSTYWLCQCDCGNQKVARLSHMIAGRTGSCGCLSVEMTRKRATRHGMVKTPTWISWHKMIERCTDPRNIGYGLYGGRGITVCDEWRTFENFLSDMGLRPSLKYSLDRIDNSLGYSKSNCRWATDIEQANNTRNNKRIQICGTVRTLAEWCRFYGVDYGLVQGRIAHGWEPSKALTTPRRNAA